MMVERCLQNLMLLKISLKIVELKKQINPDTPSFLPSFRPFYLLAVHHLFTSLILCSNYTSLKIKCQAKFLTNLIKMYELLLQVLEDVIGERYTILKTKLRR